MLTSAEDLKSSIDISEAVRRVFEEYPDRDWTPQMLHDAINKLRSEKLLDSEAKDLLTSIRSETIL